MLNELNKAAALPGYEHYLHDAEAAGPGAAYDMEDAWNDRYYSAGNGQRYKVRDGKRESETTLLNPVFKK